MILLSDLISRVRTRYESTSGGSSVRFTDANITDYLNEGLECLAEATSFYERYMTVPIQTGRQWYDLRGFSPETPVRIKGIYSTSRTGWLSPISEDHLEFQWEDSSGTPELYFTRGIYWLGVWPKPADTDAGYLRVYFSGIPQRFEGTPSVLRDLPDNYAPALEEYALYEMASIDKETKKAISYWGMYVDREKALGGMVDRRLVGSTPTRFGRVAR